MTKILLVGDIDLYNTPYNGEKMKNQLFLRRFSQVCDKVIPIDTCNWKKRPWVLVYLVFCLLFIRPCKVVISSCDVSASKVIKFLYYFRLQKNVYYWVVGGGFHHLIENGTLGVKYYHYLRKVLVQSPEMQQKLEEIGLKNVMYVPNSKPVYNIEPDEREESLRFVFLSRIEPTKGCDVILNCAKRFNSVGLKDKFNVAFYGTVDKDYKPFFLGEVDRIENVSYHGLLNLTGKKGYEELSKHDVFVFPTFYENEGFPGAIIDAYIAGLPIIATDWHFNKQFVRECITGVMIPAKDEDALYVTMLDFIEGRYNLNEMKRQSLSEAQKYDANNVLSVDFLKNIGLI